jgi:CBS domain-containing protein
MNAATILKQKGGGVITATANISLLDIAKLLSQHGIGCIVILGNDDKIAGIVSERDLMRAIGQAGPDVFEPASLELHDQESGHGAGGRYERAADVGNDDPSVPAHACGRERSTSRPHIYWRSDQAPRR